MSVIALLPLHSLLICHFDTIWNFSSKFYFKLRINIYLDVSMNFTIITQCFFFLDFTSTSYIYFLSCCRTFFILTRVSIKVKCLIFTELAVTFSFSYLNDTSDLHRFQISSYWSEELRFWTIAFASGFTGYQIQSQTNIK